MAVFNSGEGSCCCARCFILKVYRCTWRNFGIINVIHYTCAFHAVMSQNVCCEQGLHCGGRWITALQKTIVFGIFGCLSTARLFLNINPVTSADFPSLSLCDNSERGYCCELRIIIMEDCWPINVKARWNLKTASPFIHSCFLLAARWDSELKGHDLFWRQTGDCTDTIFRTTSSQLAQQQLSWCMLGACECMKMCVCFVKAEPYVHILTVCGRASCCMSLCNHAEG